MKEKEVDILKSGLSFLLEVLGVKNSGLEFEWGAMAHTVGAPVRTLVARPKMGQSAGLSVSSADTRWSRAQSVVHLQWAVYTVAEDVGSEPNMLQGRNMLGPRCTALDSQPWTVEKRAIYRNKMLRTLCTCFSVGNAPPPPTSSSGSVGSRLLREAFLSVSEQPALSLWPPAISSPSRCFIFFFHLLLPTITLLIHLLDGYCQLSHHSLL